MAQLGKDQNFESSALKTSDRKFHKFSLKTSATSPSTKLPSAVPTNARFTLLIHCAIQPTSQLHQQQLKSTPLLARFAPYHQHKTTQNLFSILSAEQNPPPAK